MRPFIFTLVLFLTACTGSTTAHDPASLHAAWIAALRANDRQVAQALLADDASIAVDRALAQAQYLVTLDSPQTGRLQAVDLLQPMAQGVGQQATSIWRLDRLTSCFRATLVQTSAGWRVINWEERQTDCPPAQP